jgi:uncharacterized membrane protein
VVDVSDFDGLCNAAFNMIRQNGSRSIAVAVRMLEVIEKVVLASAAMSHDRRECLLRHAALTFEQALQANPVAADARDLRDRLERVRAAASDPAATGSV